METNDPIPKQHNFKIIVTYQDQVVEENGLRLDFDTMESATIQLEITDKYESDPTVFETMEWVIIENNIRVDEDDYTGGRNAELKLYKDKAGAHNAPSYVDIQIVHPTEGVVDTVRLELVATPTIEKADWVDLENYNNIVETKFNTFVGIHIDGEGIQGIPLTVDIHLFDDDQIIDHLTAQKDRSIHQVELKKKWHTKHHLFFSVVKKVYAVISYLGHEGTQVLYNGKEKGNLLTIDGKKTNREPQVISDTLMTVTIGSDPYFTQRYEPCKYETISYTFANESKVIFFDESQQTTATPYRQPNISIRVGAHKQPLVIEVEGHTPDSKCSAVERGEEAHTPRMINAEEIPEQYIDCYEGNKVSFTPYFPYDYLDDDQKIVKNRYLNFLADYFFPPESKAITIPVETCRYAKNVNVEIHPDIAWALHFRCALDSAQLEKKPDQLEIFDRKDMYFREIEDIKLHIGLNDLIDKYGHVVQKVLGGNIPSAIWPSIPDFSPQSFIWGLIISYVRSLGACMGVGLHTYYNEEDKDTRQIVSYTEQYPWVVNTLLVYPILVLIAADILALIFSGGSTKAAQLGLKITSKTARAAAKLQKYQDRFEWIERKTEHGAFHIAWPVLSLSLGKGYRVHPDGSSGYHYEIKCTATPIFGLLFRSEGTMGDLVVDFSPIGWGFTLARFGVGMVGKVLRYKKYAKNAPLAKRVFELGVDKKKSMFRHITDTHKALNKGSKNKDYITPGRIIGILNKAEDNVKKKAEGIIKEMGLELNFYFSIEGTYRGKFEIDINLDDPTAPQLSMRNHLPDGTYTSRSGEHKDSEGKPINEVAFSRKKSIDAFAYLAINHNIRFMTNWIAPYIPNWLGVTEEDFKTKAAQTSIEGKAMLMGGISFELKYGCDTHLGPYMQEYTHFSGIAGKYSLRVKRKRAKEDKDIIVQNEMSDNTQSKNPEKEAPMVEFILMEPRTIGGAKRYLLTKEGITDAIQETAKTIVKNTLLPRPIR